MIDHVDLDVGKVVGGGSGELGGESVVHQGGAERFLELGKAFRDSGGSGFPVPEGVGQPGTLVEGFNQLWKLGVGGSGVDGLSLIHI